LSITIEGGELLSPLILCVWDEDVSACHGAILFEGAEMAMYDDLPPAIRQGASWKPLVMLAFAACILTMLSIQLGGQIRSQRKAAHAVTATAVVEQCPPVIPPRAAEFAASKLASQTLCSSKTVQYIKDQVTSPELIRQALNDFAQSSGERNTLFSLATADTVKSIQQELQVEVAESPLGGKCLRLHLPWQNAQFAAKFLKILGQRYADQYRSAWTNENSIDRLAIQTAVARTAKDYDEAVAQLDFFQQYLDFAHFGNDEANVNSTAQEPRSPVNATSPLRSESDTENPQWIDLQTKLADMRKKEAKLLESRTSVHPEVAFVQNQIREYESQLAMTSHWLHAATSPLPAREVPGMRTGESAVASNPSSTQNTQSEADNEKLLAQLENDVELASEAYREAVSRDQTATDQQKILPQITIQAWEPQRIATLSKTSSTGSFGWLAGIVMALGVSLICTGTAIESPIGSAEELQRLTAVPIVGVIPSYNPAVDPRVVKRTKSLFRFGLFLSGLMLIGLCAWAIVRLM
jgi:hypothetical protein